MVHFKVTKNDKFWAVEMADFDLETIIRQYDIHKKMIYITEEGKLTGMVGASEIKKMRQTGEIAINKNGTFLTQNCYDENEAYSLFKTHLNWCGIPVVGKDDEIVYEYTYSHQRYYEELSFAECDGIYKGHDRDYKIVVSMTTHDERLKTVYLALKSIMIQTMKADEIILYLAKGSGDGYLDHEEELIKCGIKVARGLEDLKCHKKYFYSLSEKSDSIVITTDDDKLYDDQFIEGLYNKHCEYPEAVICRLGDRIKYKNGKVCTYISWNDYAPSSEPESQVCIKSHAGVLYPIGEYRQELLKKDALMSLSKYNDDLWVTACLQENSIKVYNMGEDSSIEIIGTRETALGANKNETVRRNDKYVRDLKNHFSRAYVE